MSQTIFRGSPPGRYSIGNGDRYCQITLTKFSGDVIPAGATISSVSLNMSNVDIHSTGYGGTGRGIKINDVRLADFAMTPHADHVNFTLNNILATPELYVGKSALTFWIGFESGAAQHDWCSFNGACVVSVTVNYEAKSSATLQSSTVEAGTNVRVNITRANAGYTHKVTYALGTYSEVHTGVATVDNYTIPLAWCNAMPNTVSGNGTVTVETFNGAQSLGSVTLALTVTVPASAVPTAGTLNLGAVGLLDGQYYVQGRTTITPTVSGQSGIYGSTIVGLQFTHSGLLTQSGSVTITATVTDSRGRTAQTTKTITVYAYNDPVQAVEMFRCDEDGNRDDSGDKVWVKSTVTGTPIPSAGSNVNILTIIAEYREVGAGSWTGTRFLTSGTGVVMDGPFDTTKSYEVRVIVSELAGGGSIKVETIQTSGFLLFIRKDGTGAAFGKACEHSNALEIPADWDWYQGSNKLVDLIYPVGSIYMSVNNVSPQTLIGGTWQRIQDTFLLAAGSSHAAGTTGGEETHTLSASEMPSHKHRQKILYNQTGYGAETEFNYSLIVKTPLDTGAFIDNGTTQYTNINTRTLMSSDNTGGGAAHNNMPPYLTVYMWKRTA